MATTPTTELDDNSPPNALTLEQAIDLSYSSSPALQVMRERMAQSQGDRSVAFSEFLPEVKTSFRPMWGDSECRFICSADAAQLCWQPSHSAAQAITSTLPS